MTQLFSQLPVRVLINDPKKKRYVHQLGPMTYFLTTQKFDLILLIWDTELDTHLQSFLCLP